jgi:hypothetical protein
MATKPKPKQSGGKPKKGSEEPRACGHFCGVRTAVGEPCKKPCLKPPKHPGVHTCGDHRYTDPDF